MYAYNELYFENHVCCVQTQIGFSEELWALCIELKQVYLGKCEKLLVSKAYYRKCPENQESGHFRSFRTMSSCMILLLNKLRI